MYSSPTEMVINMMKDAIVDEAIVCQKAKEEICRRYLTYQKQYMQGNSTKEVIDRVKYLMEKNNIQIDALSIVQCVQTLIKANPTWKMIGLDLEDNKKVVVTEEVLLSAGANLILVALQNVAKVDISGIEMHAMLNKKQVNAVELKNLLDTSEKGMMYINKLRGINAHASYILSNEEEQAIKSLGINITCEPKIL